MKSAHQKFKEQLQAAFAVPDSEAVAMSFNDFMAQKTGSKKAGNTVPASVR